MLIGRDIIPELAPLMDVMSLAIGKMRKVEHVTVVGYGVRIIELRHFRPAGKPSRAIADIGAAFHIRRNTSERSFDAPVIHQPLKVRLPADVNPGVTSREQDYQGAE